MLHATLCSMISLMLLCCIWRSYRFQSCIRRSNVSHDVSIHNIWHLFSKVSIRISTQWRLLNRTSQIITLWLLVILICRIQSMYVLLLTILFLCLMS